MINRKKGANNNDQNFIKRCVKDEVDWDVSRIAAHLLIEESVVQNFYDGFVKELENEDSDSEPEKVKAAEEEITAEEDFS